MRRIIAATALILAGCATTAPPPAMTCGAAGLQGLIGQSALVLQTMRFGATTRILRPNDPVTKDYRPDRLNIIIDEKERISRVTCG